MRLVRSLAVLLGLTAVVSFPNSVHAEVKLPAVFGSHMVLQRDAKLPVWGWAEAGEKVTVSFRDQSVSTTAGNDGKWSLALEPVGLGDPGTMTVKGSNTITLEDVLVGEVWVCSGQSNMQWSVNAAIDPDLESAASTNNQLRLFYVPRVSTAEIQDDVDAEWTLCTPETVPNFSAVAYYFGRNVQQVLGVPVGLIHTSWGGTRAEAWASPESLAATAELSPILETWEKSCAAYNPEAAKAKYEAELEKWKAASEKAKAEGKPEPRRPSLESDPRLSQHHPSNLYNAMIAPLKPYAIRGAIWYQGESNAGRAYQYRKLMPVMIESWRDVWGQGDFPFYQVQLANFMQIRDEPGDSAWAELREAQAMAGSVLPKVGAACITDIGAAKDIHPKNKQDVGKRLARLALHNDYGRTDITPQGPTFKSIKVEGSDVIVEFETYGRGLISYYNEPLTGFAVAGEDKAWKWATAEVVGRNTVKVKSADVSAPVAVRYNWADNPQGNLYSDLYLPAYPFRSDEWDGVTINNVAP
ncbi:MAG: sialate O-acetylesterase [Planctomycetaceae bacterium]|nr:sialate O-acetylesterase [Planctomycetaceae bacterium]MCB9951589.1 sialate O-acetylesterase [Planctomycetaceae bacterium]